MNDGFFTLHDVTYTGSTLVDSTIVNVEMVLMSTGVLCDIDITIMDIPIPNFGTIDLIGTLVGGVILGIPFGDECDFAGMIFEVNSPIIVDANIDSGIATLSIDGQSLDTMNFVVDIPPIPGILPNGLPNTPIPNFSADCESVK